MIIEKSDLLLVKKSLQQNIGRSVRLVSRHGRKKAIVSRGTIESIYPCIFTIRLDSNGSDLPKNNLVSYSYADVLTKTIELALIKTPVKNPDAVTA